MIKWEKQDNKKQKQNRNTNIEENLKKVQT